MKPEVGSNAPYHGCIILSVQKNEQSPVQVLDSIGFYGVTPCSDKNPAIRWLKKNTGVDIDFTGGYGEYRTEEMRYLDKGEGLTGISFHLSAHRFSTLRQSIKDDINQQNIAISEATQAIVADNLAIPNNVEKAKRSLAANHYPIDAVNVAKHIEIETKKKILSHQIYQKECEYSEKNQVPSRLKPFEFRASWTPLSFFTLADSHTCKNGIIELLGRAEIPLSALEALGGVSYRSSSSIPRFSRSSNAEELQLYSLGTYTSFTSKRTGEHKVTRSWQPNLTTDAPDKTTLYWSIPPGEIIADHTNEQASKDFLNRYFIEPAQRKLMCDLMLRLQKTEHLLVQSQTANVGGKIEALLKKLRFLITAFNNPKKNKDTDYVEDVFLKTNHLLGAIYSTINQPDASLNIIALYDDVSQTDNELSLELSEKEIRKLSALHQTHYGSNEEVFDSDPDSTYPYLGTL